MEDFKDVMSKRTDEELFRIISIERKDYQPLAVIAAEEEIKNRNLDSSRINEINLIITNKISQQNLLKIKIATKPLRFLNFIVDALVIFLIYFLITYPFNIYLESAIGQIFFVLIYIVYYVILEVIFQKTIGKFITKTKVITTEEGKPSAPNIIKRTLCRVIPFDQVSYLFTLNGFHDRFSDTTVIKD